MAVSSLEGFITHRTLGYVSHGMSRANMPTTPLTLVGNSADSPALFLRLSPVTGHAAEILDVEDPSLGYDAETFPYQPPPWTMRSTLRAALSGR
jgi:hypothetical protein